MWRLVVLLAVFSACSASLDLGDRPDGGVDGDADADRDSDADVDRDSDIDGTEVCPDQEHVGMVEVTGRGDLEALRGVTVMTADLVVEDTELGDLAGLECLREVGGTLRIMGNAALGNLHGLESLEVVGGSLYLIELASLNSLDGLASLTEVYGDVMIHTNAVLPACEAEALADRLVDSGFQGMIEISGNGGGTCGPDPCEALSSCYSCTGEGHTVTDRGCAYCPADGRCVSKIVAGAPGSCEGELWAWDIFDCS